MISFAEKYPDLVGEWAPENEASPSEVSYGSNRMIMWRGMCGHYWTASAKNRGKGHGCPYCSGNRVLIGYNDLRTRAPEVAREWSKRNKTKPEDYASLSNTEVWWTCKKCKTDWKARIADRTTGHGCPNCASTKIIRGKNDFETLFPEIAKEWSTSNPGMPFSISPYSKKSILWDCLECGNSWYGSVVNRVNGLKCPYCSGEKLMKGLNDLQTKYPDLAKEWDRIRNGNSPTMVRATSDRNSFWVDKYGHKWVARVSERVQGRGGCPKCREKSKRIEILDYVAEKAEILGLEVKKNAEYFPGIPFEAFIPKIKTAIVVTKDCEGVELKNQDTLNYYCMSSGIAMFRVLFPEAPVFSNCKVYRLLSTEDEGYKPIIDNLLEVEGLNIVKKLNNAIASTYGGSNPQDDVETLDSPAHVRASKNNRARTGAREFDNDGLNDTLDSKARHGALGALEEKNGALESKARNGALGALEKNSSSLEITHKIAIGATSDALLANNLIRIIREWPEISQDDLAQQLGVTRRVIQRVTNNLKKKGIIDRTGGKRFGRWEVYGEVDDVVIPNANSIPKENKPTLKAKKSQKKKVPLSPKKKKYSRYSLEYHILAAIKENPYITQIELSESLDSAICTIKRTTTRMIDDGAIMRTGGKRFGKWEIVDPDNN